MPLPAESSLWPLPGLSRAIREEMQEHSAWYSGDVESLRTVYGGKQAQDRSRPGRATRIIRRARQFWSRQGTSDATGSEPIQMHVPLAGDIAATSADLLLSEAPTIELPDEATKTKDRLDEIIESAGVHNTWLEACEVAAALGGAFLRPAWDRDVSDDPILSVVQADKAVPEFRYGMLRAVTFHRELRVDGNKRLRHLERHEPGVVFHGLFDGTPEGLGKRVPFTEHPETAGLAAIVEEGDKVTLDGWDRLMVFYLPNIRPNRRHRNSYLGRSDLQGIEALLDALDETWSSWMRDIRLGKRRIIVSDQYITGPGARGEGGTFNVDTELFTTFDFDPSDKTPGITPVDFEIRTEAHAKTALDIVTQAVTTAGYSPQSFGYMGEGAAVTATEVNARERKSLKTRGKKERYVRGPLADSLELMLHIDRHELGKTDTEVARPRVTLADSISETEKERAETVELFARAQAVSTMLKVEMLHPDWSDDEVSEEVNRILAESGAAVPSLALPGDEG